MNELIGNASDRSQLAARLERAGRVRPWHFVTICVLSVVFIGGALMSVASFGDSGMRSLFRFIWALALLGIVVVALLNWRADKQRRSLQQNPGGRQ
jgi:hypothetical protein